MKKVLFLAVVLVVVVFFSLSAFAATIGFEPASQIVPVGESVSVDLVISGLGDGTSPSLGGFDLFIEYDPTILALSDVSFGDPTLGDQLDVSGWGSLYEHSSYFSNVEYLFGLSYNLPWDLNDLQKPSFVLATLTFDTLSVGTSSLEIVDPDPPFFASRLADENGNCLSFDSQSGNISAVPVPTTLILLGSGLSGVWILRRKKFG